MDSIQGHTRENTYQRKPAYLNILCSVTYFTYKSENLHIIEQEY